MPKKAKNGPSKHETIQSIGPIVKPREVRSLQSWEVEGHDYIFKWPASGEDWFVVRCGPKEKPFIFQSHPFEEDRAMKHFNETACRHHDSDIPFTGPMDILKDFGYKGGPAYPAKFLPQIRVAKP